MIIPKVVTFFFLTRLLLVHGLPIDRKHYIVYMGEHSHPTSESVVAANHEMLASVIGSDHAEHAAVHHYSKSFRGFSAMLTPHQARQLSERDSVISVFESRMNKIHTTHSWEFLGVNSIPQYSNLQPTDLTSNIIVGVIDTGIWPESESFSDKGLGPVPTKFKGECITGDKFTLANCNRKIVGARFYFQGFEAENGPIEEFGSPSFRSARDSDGHGTHTASTIAGSVVANVSLFGMAEGIARGGAPNARLAIYKACWFDLCSDADILLALDDAIHDGVDILSLSLGPTPPQPVYFQNAISIGTFHAFRKGILVSCSAGNSVFPGTATNVAPWILTVAASSVDREFHSNVYIGNSKTLKGFSLNPLKMDIYYGLISGGSAAAPGVTTINASFCKNNTLDPTLVKGKIVVCKMETFLENRREKSIFVRQSGGTGMILIDPDAKEVGFQFVIPATMIGLKEAEELQAYMETEKYPVARIAPTITVLNTIPAPKMAAFSSMGPNVISPDIIKPDITGPGVNILAAWSPVASVATAERSVNYNIISGTSMSCPHISAVAAVLKSYLPTWSPAAIMSAIMTTAIVKDNTGHVIVRDPDGGVETTPFDYGSGHINPTAALDPGLVYDFDSNDIINFLCSTGATPAQLSNLTGEMTYCQNPPVPAQNFNYPSIGVSNMKGNFSVHRTVTYYGKHPTVYAAYVDDPIGVEVSITPAKLRFTKTGEKRSFRVDFMPCKNSNGSFVFGSLTWSNGIHRVRSPIGLNVISV